MTHASDRSQIPPPNVHFASISQHHTEHVLISNISGHGICIVFYDPEAFYAWTKIKPPRKGLLGRLLG